MTDDDNEFFRRTGNGSRPSQRQTAKRLCSRMFLMSATTTSRFPRDNG